MSLADVPNSMALPASAQLKLRPTGVPARRTRLNIQPYQAPNGDIKSTQLIQFYIPSRRGTMYDPQTMYLRGTLSSVDVDNALDGEIRLNRNAFSLINRLQVYGQDSTLLEDIQNYNDLVHTLSDCQMSREDKYALSAMYLGCADETTANVDNGVTLAKADGSESFDFCIPVLSSFGLLADTLIPTGWLSSDLRFDFYTELPKIVFRSQKDLDGSNQKDGTSYRLKNLELVVDQIQFEGEALSMVSQFAPPSGPLYLHASTYRTYTSTVSGTGYQTIMVPHRSLSVKQVLTSTHVPYTPGADSFGRVLPFGTTDAQLCLNIGGEKFPQKPISNTAEMFAELQKSMHSFNQLVMNGSISRVSFAKYAADFKAGAVATGALAASVACKAVLGFDTETWDKKGSTIINGANWTGLNVFLQGNLVGKSDGSGVNAATPLNLNTFVNFDVIYVVQDGQISLRY